MGIGPITNWTVISKSGRQLPGTYKIYWLVDCTFDIGDWIETHDKSEWEVSGPYNQSNYWVSEHLLLLLRIRHPRKDLLLNVYL